MDRITIRGCCKDDLEAITEICYRTGFLGEDLAVTGRFNDRKLFGYLFCQYYVLYETENCFVAIDNEDNGRVVGYIIGTCSTKKQQRRFALSFAWRIILRLIFLTSWKYPESFATVWFFLKSFKLEEGLSIDYNKYPAHLHINVLGTHQRMGIGEALLEAFEANIRNKAVGIHLGTTSMNNKAIPFYMKKGYSVLREVDGCIWNGVQDCRVIKFVKSFK